MTVCALAAAVLIAAQLAVTHWFYLYIVWFLPPLLVALVAPLVRPEEPSAAERAQDLLDRPRAAA